MAEAESRVVALLRSPGFLIGVLVLAAALRVGHVFSLKDLPLFDRLIVDSEAYDQWAQRIAAGDWLGRVPGRPFYQDPLYPYALAVVYKTIGRDLLVVRLFQIVCGVATCGLVALLGRAMRDAAAGNAGALLMALDRAAIFQDGEFEKTALSVFLSTAALALFLRPGPRWRAACGVVLGLAVLTRANLLLLVPFALVFLARRKDWRGAAALVVGLAVTIAPATIRNRVVAHEWVLTGSGMGQNFYTGNNPGNPDGAFHAVAFTRPQTAHEEGDFLQEAERRTGRSLSAHEASSFWFRAALRGMADHPAFAAKIMASKLGLFWSDVEVPDAWDMGFIARYSPVLRLPLVSFALLLALAVLGAIPALRTEAGRIAAIYIAVYAASVVAFFIFSRYRLHVVPPLAAFAGVGLLWSVERMRARDARVLLTPAVVAVLAFTFSAASFPSFRRESTNSVASLAEMYEERGNYPGARRVLDDALSRAPSDPRLLCAAGKLCLRSRDAACALDFTTRCVQANPLTPDGWYLVGLAREASGDVEGAQAAYRKQLEIVPGHEAAANRLRR